MKFSITILVFGLVAGCGDAHRTVTRPLSGPTAATRTALPSSAQPTPTSCTPGIGGYAVRIQGFPECPDTTFYEAFAPLEDNAYAEAGGPVDHPLFRSGQLHVGLNGARDTCQLFGDANQVGLADPITIFPDGTHYSKYRLTSSHLEASLGRNSGDCTWVRGSDTTYGHDFTWMGETFSAALLNPNTEFRKGGWRLVLFEEQREGDSESVNAIHLYGPGRREVIVSHVQAFPVCPQQLNPD